MTRVDVDARVDGVCVPLLSYARTASVSVYMSSLHRYSDGLICVALINNGIASGASENIWIFDH